MANPEAASEQESAAAGLEGAGLDASDKKALDALVGCLAQRAAFDDVQTFQGQSLKPAALSFFRFIHQRMPRTSKVRVFNPTETEDGWHCEHTIIEVVNDDMPFLVDSVLGELNELIGVLNLELP